MILLVKIDDQLNEEQFKNVSQDMKNLGMDIYVCLLKAKFIVGKIEDSKKQTIEMLEPVKFSLTEQEFADSLLHPNQIS